MQNTPLENRALHSIRGAPWFTLMFSSPNNEKKTHSSMRTFTYKLRKTN